MEEGIHDAMSYCPGIIPERIEENHEEPQPE
jgi:hypothetical protein